MGDSNTIRSAEVSGEAHKNDVAVIEGECLIAMQQYLESRGTFDPVRDRVSYENEAIGNLSRHAIKTMTVMDEGGENQRVIDPKKLEQYLREQHLLREAEEEWSQQERYGDAPFDREGYLRALDNKLKSFNMAFDAYHMAYQKIMQGFTQFQGSDFMVAETEKLRTQLNTHKVDSTEGVLAALNRELVEDPSTGKKVARGALTPEERAQFRDDPLLPDYLIISSQGCYNVAGTQLGSALWSVPNADGRPPYWPSIMASSAIEIRTLSSGGCLVTQRDDFSMGKISEDKRGDYEYPRNENGERQAVGGYQHRFTLNREEVGGEKVTVMASVSLMLDSQAEQYLSKNPEVRRAWREGSGEERLEERKTFEQGLRKYIERIESNKVQVDGKDVPNFAQGLVGLQAFIGMNSVTNRQVNYRVAKELLVELDKGYSLANVLKKFPEIKKIAIEQVNVAARNAGTREFTGSSITSPELNKLLKEVRTPREEVIDNLQAYMARVAPEGIVTAKGLVVGSVANREANYAFAKKLVKALEQGNSIGSTLSFREVHEGHAQGLLDPTPRNIHSRELNNILKKMEKFAEVEDTLAPPKAAEAGASSGVSGGPQKSPK